MFKLALFLVILSVPAQAQLTISNKIHRYCAEVNFLKEFSPANAAAADEACSTEAKIKTTIDGGEKSRTDLQNLLTDMKRDLGNVVVGPTNGSVKMTQP